MLFMKCCDVCTCYEQGLAAGVVLAVAGLLGYLLTLRMGSRLLR